MRKGLKIDGNEIEFNEWSIGEIWYPCITNSFKIKFDEIKLVAISPRMALDDEILLVTIIDANKQFKQFSSFEFGKEPIKKFEKRLGLNSIRDVEWGKFSWKEQQNAITDKVIYPKELYGENLFIQPRYLRRLAIQTLKFFLIKKSISGKFTPIIQNYLDN